VRDQYLRPVTTLERVDLEYDSRDVLPNFVGPLTSEDGTFECALRPCRGTIRVHSTPFGDASATFHAPENGTSHAALTLSTFASILGRVEHEGRPVSGAVVCIDELTRFGPDACEALFGCESSLGLCCRRLLGEQLTGADGSFTFAVERPGEYVLVARHDPEGAATSAPVVVADTREAQPQLLKLSPASRAEVRWTGASDPGSEVPLTIWGENGLRIDSSVTAQGAVATFDCLPAGTYEVPRPFHAPNDATTHFEVDGSATGLARRDVGSNAPVELALTYGAEDARVRARLYRLDCCARLASEEKLVHGATRLDAGDPGPHLLVLEESGIYGRTAYRRLVRLALSPGSNELAPRAITLSGELVCTSLRFLPPGVHARFTLDDGSVAFVPLNRDARSQRERRDRWTTENPIKDAAAASTPLGSCDLVHLEHYELVVLKAGVLVSAGAPTIVRL
jgi:hypothetical protein